MRKLIILHLRFFSLKTGEKLKICLFFITSYICFSQEKLKELVTWLKSKPHYNAERQTSGSIIMDPEIVKRLEDTIDAYLNKEIHSNKRVTLRVKPQFLFRVILKNMGLIELYFMYVFNRVIFKLVIYYQMKKLLTNCAIVLLTFEKVTAYHWEQRVQLLVLKV